MAVASRARRHSAASGYDWRDNRAAISLYVSNPPSRHRCQPSPGSLEALSGTAAAVAAKADKADTEAAKAADEKFKSDLDATCAEKASDFAERQQLRTEELEAVNKAIEIMGGDAVFGSADKHLPALMQTKKIGRAHV